MPKDQTEDRFHMGRGKQPTVPTKSICKLFNLTDARISQLAQQGIIKKEGRGRWALYDTIHAYITYLQTRKINQWDSDENPSDIKKEQLRRTKEEADKLELQNARTRGELVEVSRVVQMGEKVMAAMKTKILNAPLTDKEKDSLLIELLSVRDMDFSEE